MLFIEKKMETQREKNKTGTAYEYVFENSGASEIHRQLRFTGKNVGKKKKVEKKTIWQKKEEER